MKKIFTFLFCVALGTALWAGTPDKIAADLFQDDLSLLDNEFSGLTALEQVVENEKKSYSELVAAKNPLLSHVSDKSDIYTSLLATVAPEGERLLGIPGFCWGFCLGILGVLLVYVAIEGETRKQEGKMAIIGCAVATALSLLIYFIAIFSYGYY